MRYVRNKTPFYAPGKEQYAQYTKKLAAISCGSVRWSGARDGNDESGEQYLGPSLLDEPFDDGWRSRPRVGSLRRRTGRKA